MLIFFPNCLLCTRVLKRRMSIFASTSFPSLPSGDRHPAERRPAPDRDVEGQAEPEAGRQPLPECHDQHQERRQQAVRADQVPHAGVHG